MYLADVRTAVALQRDKNIKGNVSNSFGCSSFKEKKNEIYLHVN